MAQSAQKTPLSVQPFTLQGRSLAAATHVPAPCALMARTRVGAMVCNRGCGFSLIAEEDASAYREFRCPFGVSCGMLKTQSPDGADMVLIGGRVFRSYRQLDHFCQGAFEMGVDLEPLLDELAAIPMPFEGDIRCSLVEVAHDYDAVFGLQPVNAQSTNTPNEIAESGVASDAEDKPPAILETQTFVADDGVEYTIVSESVEEHEKKTGDDTPLTLIADDGGEYQVVEMVEENNQFDDKIVYASDHILRDPDRWKTLNHFVRILLHSTTPGVLGESLIQQVQALTHATKVSLFRLDPVDQELKLTHVRGLPSQVHEGMRCPVAEGTQGMALESGVPLLVDLADLSSSPCSRSQYDHYVSDRFACLPLEINGKKMGVLNLTDREDDHPFSRDEIEWLGLLLQVAATVLDRLDKTEAVKPLALADKTRAGDDLGQIGGGVARRAVPNVNFLTCLEAEIARSKRYHYSFSLALLHIHLEGVVDQDVRRQLYDLLIEAVARIVKPGMRTYDLSMLYHPLSKINGVGEVLAVILPETPLVAAQQVVKRLQAMVYDRLDGILSGKRIQKKQNVFLEVGLAEYPTHGQEAENLRQEAEVSLRLDISNIDSVELDNVYDLPDIECQPIHEAGGTQN